MSALLVLAENATALVDRIDLNKGGTNGQMILAVALGLYMLALFGLSLFASKNIQNEEDFLVAGRRLGLFLCWGSLIATWFGAASMTGAAQAAREEGMVGTVLDPWACSFTLIIAGLFYAKPLWRMKLLTTGDFFRRVYGPKAELVCCSVQIPSYFGWIAGQYLALSAVQEAYFGIPQNWGIFIGFAIALIYTMVGGMWSVTLTDTVQIVIAFIGLLVLGYVSMEAFGAGSFSAGVDRFFEKTPAEDLSLMFGHDATLAVILAWCGTWATGLFGNLPGQDLQQRMFSAKDEKTAARACIISGVSYLAFGLIPVGLGLMSRVDLPPDVYQIKVRVLMYMAGKNLDVYLAVIFVVSFVSIVMSTACSAVLAPATILGHNFLSRLPMFQKDKLTLERVCVALISFGALGLAYSGSSVFGLLDLSLSLALVGLFVPLTMGLYGKPRGQLSAVLATILGVTAFAVRHVPEMVPLPGALDHRLPAAFEALGDTEDQYDTLIAKVPAEEQTDEKKVALMAEARLLARGNTVAAWRELAGPEQAEAMTEASFDDGLAWDDYIRLRYSRERCGSFLHSMMSGWATVSADLYGLFFSLLGYFIGQQVLKRRGCSWKPGALEPPAATSH